MSSSLPVFVVLINENTKIWCQKLKNIHVIAWISCLYYLNLIINIVYSYILTWIRNKINSNEEDDEEEDGTFKMSKQVGVLSCNCCSYIFSDKSILYRDFRSPPEHKISKKLQRKWTAKTPVKSLHLSLASLTAELVWRNFSTIF